MATEVLGTVLCPDLQGLLQSFQFSGVDVLLPRVAFTEQRGKRETTEEIQEDGPDGPAQGMYDLPCISDGFQGLTVLFKGHVEVEFSNVIESHEEGLSPVELEISVLVKVLIGKRKPISGK